MTSEAFEYHRDTKQLREFYVNECRRYRRLGEVDPSHKGEYFSHIKAYLSAIETIDFELKERLKGSGIPWNQKQVL